MPGPQKLPDLVESIYDAGIDPSRWNDAVAGVRDFVGGQACGVFSKDSISKFGVTTITVGRPRRGGGGAGPRGSRRGAGARAGGGPRGGRPPRGGGGSGPERGEGGED